MLNSGTFRAFLSGFEQRQLFGRLNQQRQAFLPFLVKKLIHILQVVSSFVAVAALEGT
jgi:hypothetical protein